MPDQPYQVQDQTQPKQKTKAKITLRRALVCIFILLVLIIVGLALAFSYELSHTSKATPGYTYGIKQHLTTSVVYQSLLTYNNSNYLIPYSLLGFNVTNSSTVQIEDDLFATPAPTSIYILNASTDCISCLDVKQVYSSLEANLTTYGVLNSTNTAQVIPQSGIASIRNYSALVLLNGLLPSFFLTSHINGQTVLNYLLSKGVSIIYIGQNFSTLVSNQSVIIPSTNLPSYLSTNPQTSSKVASGYYFNQTTFNFNGSASLYGPIAYRSADRGYIVAFSNYLTKWRTPQQAGSDIAKTIVQAFWIKRYAVGFETLTVPNTKAPYNSIVGIILNKSRIFYSRSNVNLLNSGYFRAIVLASNSVNPTLGSKGIVYNIVSYKPQFTAINGSISMPSTVFATQPFTAKISIFTSQPILLEPHLEVFTKDSDFVSAMPPIFTQNISANYTFFKNFQFKLPPGGYIAELYGFLNQRYAAVYFSVPPVNLNLIGINGSSSTVQFKVTSGGHPISNVSATVIVNNQYPETTNITNGVLTYTLPKGTSIPSGNLTFSVSTLYQVYSYRYYYSPIVITVNKEYVEFVIAIIIVLLEVTLVKAPIRDEFYIDIPTMPEPVSTNIKLKANEVLGVFDKLNLYYHWRYMPLSRNEFKFAISNNVRANAMPVTLTLNNVDLILNEMVGNGYLISTDGLFAPKTWIEQSKHDIEYLATFKKLRVYLVGKGHIFTDLDKSEVADIVTTLHNEKAYIIIYSPTSKFKKVPVQKDIKTYMAFLNSDKLEEFKRMLFSSTSRESEEIKMYVSVGSVKLIDADNPEGILS